MNYKRVYDELISYRQETPPIGYIEHHHILPKCLGGDNKESNIVQLTAREHYIAHLLLHKIYKLPKTAYALWMMNCGSDGKGTTNRYRINSRWYEWAKLEFIKRISKIDRRGNKNSQFGSIWICNVDTQTNKKIKQDECIPEGWVRGRNKWKPKWKANPKPKGFYKKNSPDQRKTDEFKEKMRQIALNRSSISSEARRKMSIRKQGNKSLTGKIWITNGQRNRVINKQDNIPNNWYKGRITKKRL